MKKLIASIVAVIALAASAAPQKVAVVRLADSAGMVSAANKVCMMVGNPMFSGYAAQGIMDCELYRMFGTPRGGLPFTMPVFADLDKLDSESPEFAVLLPIDGKEAFLARFKDVQEKDGMSYVENDSNSVFKKVYFTFSDDGKWVAACDKPQFAKMALGCIEDAKPLEGDIVRGSVCGKFFRKTLDLVDKDVVRTSGNPVLSAKYKNLLAGIEGVSFELGVGDDGISMRGAIKTAEGSEMAKIGRKTLGANALASAVQDAVAIEAYAEDSFGSTKREVAKAVLDFVASKGFKTDFLNAVFGAETLTCCIDIPALVTYIKGEGSETFSKLDPQQFVSEWSKMYSGLEYKVEGPAFVTSAAIKGFKPKATVAERFAKTLPEAAGKPLSLVEVTSLYTILKAAAAQLADVCDEIKEFKPLIATLPDEGTGAIASASWREGGDLRYVARISSDEIKSLGATANIAIGAVMAQMMSAMSEEDDDEDCDCEDDEDDDD
jgi:hypothetical protein